VPEPSLLAVTSQLPWPLDSGGHLRTYHLLRALAARFRVRLVAGVPAQGTAIPLDAFEDAGIRLHPVPLPARTWPREGWRLAAATAAGDPYVLYRRHDWDAMHAAVAQAVAAEPPAVLYLDHLDGYLFARHRGGSRVALDLHNVYSRLIARTAVEPGLDPLRRRFLAREARLLAATEARAAADVDAVFAVSAEEAAYYGALRTRPAVVVPNGVDCARQAVLPTGRPDAAPTMLFIGTLNWTPNIQAAVTLATQVLPALRAERGDAALTLVGRDPAPEVTALAGLPGVRLAGSVPDVLPWLRDAALLAVPLESGGGTRLKILEAFAAGLPVVSTAVGCEGLGARDGEHLVVAERDQFAHAVLRVLSDRALGVALATRARALARERYDWSVVGAAAVTALDALLAPGR